MEYKIPADLLQAIVNILQEAPAKVSFKVLQAIDELTRQQSEVKAPPKQEKV